MEVAIQKVDERRLLLVTAAQQLGCVVEFPYYSEGGMILLKKTVWKDSVFAKFRRKAGVDGLPDTFEVSGYGMPQTVLTFVAYVEKTLAIKCVVEFRSNKPVDHLSACLPY